MAFAMNLRKPLRRANRRCRATASPDCRRARPIAATMQGYDPLGVRVAHGADANVGAGLEDAGEGAADRPPADRPAVPGPRHPAGDVPRVRRAHHVFRREDRQRRARRPTATATEMQMLSQRLSSSSTLALQGRPSRSTR